MTVCICTRRRREGLRRLLESIENIEIPSEIVIKILIVENDSDPTLKDFIKEWSEKSRFEVTYCLESNPGIVYARNRSVAEAGNCDFICFTDDDQIVANDWMKELIKCQAEFNADGVAGPTWPIFDKEVHSCIRKFYQPDTYPYGTQVESAFTGNLLIRKRVLDLLEGPFDPRLNLSGGEDSFLTKQITDSGGSLRFNPDAVAYEFVPENRTKLMFIVKRSFRISNTRHYINSIFRPDIHRVNIISRLIARFSYGLLISVPHFFIGGRNRLKGIIKVSNAIGGFAFILGKRSQFYR